MENGKQYTTPKLHHTHSGLNEVINTDMIKMISKLFLLLNYFDRINNINNDLSGILENQT